jgi:hypothetical protein
VVLSLTSHLPLLYAAAFRNRKIHLILDPINPRFLRIYRVPKPTLEEGEILPTKPVPHTYAAINRTGIATDQVADTTWAAIHRASLKFPEKSPALPATTILLNFTR